MEELQKLATQGAVTEQDLHHLQRVVAHSIPKLRAAASLRAKMLRPGRFICHRDPVYGFVVMILAWGPGDATPIHDHGTWGVEGVLEGVLSVTEYDDSEMNPKPLTQRIIGPGATMSNLPPNRDVHRVASGSCGLSVSLHIYGREITGNRIFVPGEGFQQRHNKADEYAFLDVAGVGETEAQTWGLLWQDCSML